MAWLRTLAAGVIVSGCAGPLAAQTTAGVNTGIQFDFSLPGARSLGMAGAFVAVADDATASQSNPAGLTILRRPEISIEGRLWNYFSLVPLRGHALCSPTGVGIDTISGLVDGELKDTEQSVAFLSFVYPMDKWAIAGFRHQFSNFRNRTITEGPFQDLSGGPFAGSVSRINPSTGDIDLSIASYGVSVAGRLGDTFSVGAGVAVSTFSIESFGEAAIARPHDVLLPPNLRPLFTATGQQFGPADYSDRSVLVVEQQFGEDTGVGFNVGALWRPSDRVSVGVTFRRGPLFHFDAQFDGGPAFTEVAPGFNTALDRDTGIRFKTPDYFAAGVALSPSDAVKITFEYNRVQYSQLLNGDGNGLPVDSAGRLEFPDPAVQAEGLRVQNGLTIDDADQFRVGAEIVLIRAPKPVLFRIGAWYDPNHQVYFVDRGPDTSFNPRIQSLFVMLPQRDDEFHFSTGAGIAFSRFQIDGAVDLSPRINTASVSAVFYLR